MSIKALYATLLFSLPLIACGAETTEPPGVFDPAASNWRIAAALGYGIRSNPLIQSEDIPIVVDLDIAWFGKRFFFDNGDVGWTVTDNDWFTLSLMGRFNSDRVFFGKTNTRLISIGTSSSNQADVEITVPDRDYAIEAGAELLADGNWGRLQLTAFTDVSSTHGGNELGAIYSYGVRRQRWYLEPSIGFSFKSQKLNDYYWGVRPEEANEALPVYELDAGMNVELRIAGSYQLSRNWTLAVVAEYERLNDEMTSSPIVSDSHVTGFFAGFGYRF